MDNIILFKHLIEASLLEIVLKTLALLTAKKCQIKVFAQLFLRLNVTIEFNCVKFIKNYE